MKKFLKYLVTLILLLSTVSALCFSASALEAEKPDGYDEYGYYAKFDFEEYEMFANEENYHLAYMRASTAKNADGKLCDPFDYMSNWGAVDGIGAIVEETSGNHYYSIKSIFAFY